MAKCGERSALRSCGRRGSARVLRGAPGDRSGARAAGHRHVPGDAHGPDPRGRRQADGVLEREHAVPPPPCERRRTRTARRVSRRRRSTPVRARCWPRPIRPTTDASARSSPDVSPRRSCRRWSLSSASSSTRRSTHALPTGPHRVDEPARRAAPHDHGGADPRSRRLRGAGVEGTGLRVGRGDQRLRVGRAPRRARRADDERRAGRRRVPRRARRRSSTTRTR